MKTRTFISNQSNGDIQYQIEGCDIVFYCNKEDWEKYELMVKLIKQGADENLLEELYGNGYFQGYDAAY